MLTGSVVGDSQGEPSAAVAFNATFPVAKSRDATAVSPALTAMFMPAALSVQVVDSSADSVCPMSGWVLSGGASLFRPAGAPHALKVKLTPSSSFNERFGCAAEACREACPTSKRLLIEKAPYTQENSPREPDAATQGESF